MNYLKIIAHTILSILILTPNLYAQYDAGTIIHSETGSSLNTVLKNYQVVDFDGDTYVDIIMVKNDAATNSNQLTWYKGNGNGDFSPQNNLLSVSDAHKENEIFYEDMNGDGNKDIVFQNSDTGFTTLLNDGQGNISAQINNTATIGNIIGADLKEMADLDGDGDMDGIFWAKTDSLTFFGQNLGHCFIGYNNGTGTFSNYNYLENNDFSVISQVETGDIDGDGDLDIITNVMKFWAGGISIGSPRIFYPYVRLYKNTGNNNYSLKEEIDLILATNRSRLTYINIKLQDINSDSTAELLVEYIYEDSCEDDLHWWGCENFNHSQIFNFNVQNETYVTLEHYNSWLHGYNNVFPETAFVLDSNGVQYNEFQMQFGHQNTDNNLDILTINVPQGKMHWFYGDGNGGFSNGQVVNFNNQYSSIKPTLRVADMDNDSDLDIFVLLNDDTSSNLTVFENLALSPACSSVLDLAATPLTNGIYQAGATLISSGDVSNGNNVTLKAGNRVRLENGFRIPQNSLVKVKIDPCN